MKQKKKKKLDLKWPTHKNNKTEIFKIANSLIFLWKFQVLVLGLIEMIDAKAIDVAQSM